MSSGTTATAFSLCVSFILVCKMSSRKHACSNQRKSPSHGPCFELDDKLDELHDSLVFNLSAGALTGTRSLHVFQKCDE